MKKSLLKGMAILTLFFCLLLPNLAQAQVMALPAHASVYSPLPRGYWFTAPIGFTITGLKVPIEAGTGTQYIHIFKCNDPFPIAAGAGSSNFTTLAYISNAPNNVMQTVNIVVNQGDRIGILASVTGGNCSYSASAVHASSINGLPVTLTRLGNQTSSALESGPIAGYWGEAATTAGQIGRIEMQYSVGPCTNPPFLGNAISNKTQTCSGESFLLSLDTATTGTGQNYQWQSSPDSLVWTNITGATTSNYAASQTTTTYYRVNVTCGVMVSSSGVKVTTSATALPGGTYTINSALPTSGTNYASFSAFKQAIVCGGISGPIVVNVAPNAGGYNEQVAIGSIGGTSATNTITINGNGALLTHVGGAANRATLTIDGSSYINIKKLIIEGTGTANSYGVELRNNANHILFDSCTVRANLTSTVSTVGAFITSNSPTGAATAGLAASNLTVTNSIIEGGYYGMVINGPTAAPWSENNIIENNQIRNYYVYGLYIRGQKNSSFKNNDIHRMNSTAISTFYGIYVTSGMEGTKIYGNRMHNSNDMGSAATTNYVMYITTAVATAASPLEISNNVIYNMNNTGVIYGVYLLSGDHIRFLHNTINLDDILSGSSTGTIRGLYCTASSGNFDFKNNLFSVSNNGTGAKHIVYISSTVPTYTFTNNQYNLGSTVGVNAFGYYGGTVADFAAWKTVNNGAFDQNGVYGDPIFNTTNVFTPQTSIGNAAGVNLLATVPTDIFGAARTTTPDIGAVEYVPLTCLQPLGFSGISTSTTITLNWTNDPDADSVHIEYGPSGFNQGTGTGINVTGSTFTANGLFSQTCYDFYVYTWCNGVAGNGTTLFTYCTKCGAKTVPFTENFDATPVGSTTNPSLPECWSYYKSGVATNVYGYTYATGTPNSAPNHFRMYNANNTDDTLALISPAISGIALGDKRVRFWAKSAATTYNAPIIVGTVPSPDQMHLFTIMDTLEANSTYAEYIKTFNVATGYNGTDEYVVFMYGNLSTAQSVYIDDITFELVPQCAPPIGVTSSTITSSGATITWGSVSGNCFKLEYGPQGFTHSTGQGTKIQNATSPTTLTGLMPNTFYDVYVFDCCDTLSPSIVYTFKTNCVAQLSGTYTIGGTPGANNFATLDSAIAMLNGCGITGPVTFNMQGGTHGAIALSAISGASATNTITFNGSANHGDSIVASGQTAAIDIDGASYINFNGLYVENTSAAFVVWLHNAASHISIDNSALIGSPTTTTAATAVVAATSLATSAVSYGDNASHISISNSYISGNYYGISLNGTSTAIKMRGISLVNNTIENVYYYGIRTYYADSILVEGNQIPNGFRNTANYGMYMYYTDNANIIKNAVYGAVTSAISFAYTNYTDATAGSQSTMINNMFQASGTYGCYLYYPSNTNVYHNSIQGGTTYGMYITGTATATVNLNVRNNIFVNSGTGTACYVGTEPGNTLLDYNVYSSGGNIGNGQATLAAWKAAKPTWNQNSIQGVPGFVSNSDFHIIGTLPNNVGLNGLATVDIDGDARPASGATNVDIGADEYTPLQNDIFVSGIVEPIDQSCGDSSTVVKVAFTNFGTSSAANIGFTANVSGALTTTLNATYTGTLLPQQTDTISFPAINTVAGGTFTIVAYSNLTGDQNTNNDTSSATLTINDVLVRVPVASQDTVCVGQSVTLYYPSNAGNQSFMWLTTTGDTIGTTDSLAVGPMGANDTTFVMRAEANGFSVGPLDNTIGASANYTAMNHFLQFTVNTTTTIGSVDVFATGAGLVDVLIQDGTSNATLFTHTIPILSGGKQTLVLNRTLTPGTYRMGGSTTNNAGGLQRNSAGAVYPYTAPDNSIVITGNTFSATAYYFFYNWQIGSAGCPRPDGMVTIYNGGGVSGNFTSALQPPTATDLTVNFDASAVVGSSSYTWYYGDGGTGTGVTSSHSYTANGTYNAILEVTSSCGVDSIVQQIVIAGIGIEETLLSQSLNVYPNPNNGEFRITFMVEGVKHTNIRVMNAMGQMMYDYTPGNISGEYKQEINLSREASGVYILQITTDDGIISRRITVRK